MSRMYVIATLAGVVLLAGTSGAQVKPTPTPVIGRPTPTVRAPTATPTPGGATPTPTPGGGGVSPLPTRTPVDESSCLGLVFDTVPGRERYLPGTSSVAKVSASKVMNLGMSVLFPSTKVFGPADMMEIRVKTPRGHLYQKLEVPLAGDGLNETQRPMAGYPHPVEVSRAEASTLDGQKYQMVRVPALQVGGTAITKGSLYGLWTVEAWPPGAVRPCTGQIGITQ